MLVLMQEFFQVPAALCDCYALTLPYTLNREL